MTKKELWDAGDELERKADRLEIERTRLEAEMLIAGPTVELLERRKRLVEEDERCLAEQFRTNVELIGSAYYGEAFNDVEKLRNFAWGSSTYEGLARDYIRAFDSAPTAIEALNAATSLVHIHYMWRRKNKRAQEQP